MSETEDLLELCASPNADWHVVQESGDLYANVGYHWTSQRGADHILREGLGATVEWPEDHEIFYIFCVLTSQALDRVTDVIDKHGLHSPKGSVAVVEALQKTWDEPRAVWYAIDPEYEGDTASYTDVRFVLDLDAIADWLGEHTRSAYVFGDHAGGYGIYWDGPPIPSRFMREDTPANNPRRANLVRGLKF